MFRKYALFAIKHPKIHTLNLLITLAVMLFSCYELIENENFIFANGIAFSFVCILIFARASEYKRKYLSHK